MNDAALAIAALAADPGLGGMILRGPPGPGRDRLLGALRKLLPFAPWRRLPTHATAERLSGGLDLAATLAAGRSVLAKGLLAEVAGGVLVVAMAERLAPALAARIAAALDAGERFVMVLLDEGIDDEAPPPTLRERCAFRIEVERLADLDLTLDPAEATGARLALRSVRDADDMTEALCAASLALGVHSARPALLALRAARAVAALAGREQVQADDVAAAARLTLAWRATQLPLPPPEQPAEDAPPPPPRGGDADGEESAGALADIAVAAARAALPADLLARLAGGLAARGGEGRKGDATRGPARFGRPVGARRGRPGGGARLAVVATLHAAAPWQRLRRGPDERRIAVRPEDLRVQRLKPRAGTTTIFAVDASGSAALARLAEAKGAVERLLAECYVRRDQVALVAFKGFGADTLLPPTRSLARAKRALAQLPGGGGTPLAAGLLAAAGLAEGARRSGRQPTLVVLTDGRANVARDGTPGRAQAERDAQEAGRLIAAARVPCLLIDTSARPRAELGALAGAMRATYLPLPRADAGAIARAVRPAAG